MGSTVKGSELPRVNGLVTSNQLRGLKKSSGEKAIRSHRIADNHQQELQRIKKSTTRHKHIESHMTAPKSSNSDSVKGVPVRYRDVNE